MVVLRQLHQMLLLVRFVNDMNKGWVLLLCWLWLPAFSTMHGKLHSWTLLSLHQLVYIVRRFSIRLQLNRSGLQNSVQLTYWMSYLWHHVTFWIGFVYKIALLVHSDGFIFLLCLNFFVGLFPVYLFFLFTFWLAVQEQEHHTFNRPFWGILRLSPTMWLIISFISSFGKHYSHK